MKKVLFIMTLVFGVLTFVGAGYVLYNRGQVNAGYAVIPMIFCLGCLSFNNILKRNEDKSTERGIDKKKWLVRVALLILYGVPYVFLSINGDATSGTLIYYGIMILAFSLLCWVSNKTHNVPIVFVGNIISFISSCVFAAVFDLDAKSWYFKPFTAHSLLLVVSIVIFIIQVMAVLLFVWKKHKNSSGV